MLKVRMELPSERLVDKEPPSSLKVNYIERAAHNSPLPPSSIDVNSDLGLLHVVDALPLTHPGLVRGPCTPSPQASRAWRASHHDEIVMYPFSMISPPKLAGKGTPRLLAMGGRAGFDPSNPLDSRCKKPLVQARLQNSPILTPLATLPG